MTVPRSLLAAVILTASTLPAAADPQAYLCTFTSGAARSFEKGKFKTEKSSKVVLDIAGIDPDKQSANLVRGDATSQLRVVRAVNALHFLEIVGEGYMNVTTVYDRDTNAVKHPAVHSRHFGVLGQPIFAQYFGFCTSK